MSRAVAATMPQNSRAIRCRWGFIYGRTNDIRHHKLRDAGIDDAGKN